MPQHQKIYQHRRQTQTPPIQLPKTTTTSRSIHKPEFRSHQTHQHSITTSPNHRTVANPPLSTTAPAPPTQTHELHPTSNQHQNHRKTPPFNQQSNSTQSCLTSRHAMMEVGVHDTHTQTVRTRALSVPFSRQVAVSGDTAAPRLESPM
ncbi:hypothetical protein M758_1G131400 [Ceratodon purpureus]|uniref:Uncharacterized protein n=1 Tax=Ceratodon purpureus TaxID=3225 RepID=A0A8T0J7H9_CERPU|nr:hypothetical protein KC19_1G136600 [Ceratodon purpureus]KAG0629799.1 hypothetical protein M758_1G131400 [Ceratodon purpureus]